MLRGRTVPELREVCLLAGMQACGAKADLVRRLAYERNTEPSTPKKQMQSRQRSSPPPSDKFQGFETMSPVRPLQPLMKHQSCTEESFCKTGNSSEFSPIGFGLVKKVSRRRSIGVLPLVDVERSEFEAPPKLDESIKLQPNTSFTSSPTSKKRRRMSI